MQQNRSIIYPCRQITNTTTQVRHIRIIASEKAGIFVQQPVQADKSIKAAHYLHSMYEKSTRQQQIH